MWYIQQQEQSAQVRKQKNSSRAVTYACNPHPCKRMNIVRIVEVVQGGQSNDTNTYVDVAYTKPQHKESLTFVCLEILGSRQSFLQKATK